MPNKTSFSAQTSGASVRGELTDRDMAYPVAPPAPALQAVGPRVTFNFITEAWSSENSYSYYDVVNIDGASYVARQNVPTGIEISNEDYWFRWNDPNAQFAELEDIVQGYDSRITAAEGIAADAKSAAESAQSAASAANDNANARAPKVHADASGATYGQGSASLFGHVKLSDSDSTSTATSGIAATPKRVSDAASSTLSSAKSYADTKVSAVTPRISALESKTHIVVIGDSFSTLSPRAYSWPSQLGDHYTVHNYAVGGTGFVTHGSASANKNFQQQCDQAIADSSYKHESVKTVIIYGGVNDFLYDVTSSDAAQGALTCYNKMAAEFTTANVVVAFGNAGAFYGTREDGYIAWLDDAYRSTSRNFPMVNAHYWLYGFGEGVWNTDLLHPNESGAGLIAKYMLAIINGCYDAKSFEFIQNLSGGTLQVHWNGAGDLWFTGSVTASGSGRVQLELTDSRFQRPESISAIAIPYTCSNPALFDCQYGDKSGNMNLRFSSEVTNVNVYF